MRRLLAVLPAVLLMGSAASAAATWSASATGSATVGAATMTNAAGFTAACGPGGKGAVVDLSWTASPDAFVDEYEIVRTASGGGLGAVFRVPATSTTAPDNPTARDGYSYSYTIRALSNTSAWTTPLLGSQTVISFGRGNKCSAV